MARNNDLGIRGWFYGGRYGPQRVMYIIQRLSGVGIIFYLLIHIFITGSKIGGEPAWNTWVVDGVAANPFLHVGEYLLFLAIVIHGVNGFRLMLVELGFALGKPIKNIYPYETCLDRNRVFLWVCVVLIVVLAAIGTVDFFNFI